MGDRVSILCFMLECLLLSSQFYFLKVLEIKCIIRVRDVSECVHVFFNNACSKEHLPSDYLFPLPTRFIIQPLQHCICVKSESIALERANNGC